MIILNLLKTNNSKGLSPKVLFYFHFDQSENTPSKEYNLIVKYLLFSFYKIILRI